MLPRIKISQEQLSVTYKLIVDAIFIVLIFFVFALTAEGVIPGIITSHIGFTDVVLFLGIALLIISFIAKSASISIGNRNTIDKKIAYLGLPILALLILNTLIRTNPLLALSIFVLIIAAGYFTYQVIFDKAD